MKFNNAQITGNYAEVPQTNPLRWTNLFKEADGSFTRESKKWKCKDFLNELVSKYQGNRTSIYGYDAGPMRVNDEGVYVYLEHIIKMDVYQGNLRSINNWAASVGMPAMEILGEYEGGLVVLLPRKYFDSTYSISFLSYFIRVANVSEVVSDWDKHPTKAVDNPFGSYWDKAMKYPFKAPIEGYWYYAMKAHTNLEKPNTGTVHDNGVNSWLNYLTLDGVI